MPQETNDVSLLRKDVWVAGYKMRREKQDGDRGGGRRGSRQASHSTSRAKHLGRGQIQTLAFRTPEAGSQDTTARMARSSSCPRLEARWLHVLLLWWCIERRASAKEDPQAGAGCTRSTCCSWTQQASDNPDVPCCNDLASLGKCGVGMCCADKECSECRTLPKCEEGEELQCIGSLDFRFLCKPCPTGTYSDTKSGCCTPWADCKKIGLQTIQPGNRTHNVQCGTVILQPGSLFTTILAIVTAAGIFLLILMTFFLIICLWTQKKDRFHVMEDPESFSDPNLREPQELHEDGYSCQFPEEEHGDKMAEEKASLKASAH